MPELRRQRRVAYHANVRLRASGGEHSVVAHVQNLSATGIFVTAPEVPATGTEVLCQMRVAGEGCTLRGQIAWVRPPAVAGEEAAGAGIRFLEVGDRETEILAKLVEPADAACQAVDVWFEGMRTAIRSHAVVTEDGLRISTRLPFLRLQSPVKVGFERGGIEEERHGILEAVTLEPSSEDGVPRLKLVVSTPAQDAALRTVEVSMPAPPILAPLEHDLTERMEIVFPPPSPSAARPAVRPPIGRPDRRRFWAATVLVIVGVGLLAWRPWRSSLRMPPPLPPAPEVRPPVKIEPLPPPRASAAIIDPLPSAPEPPSTVALVIPIVGSAKGLERYPLAEPPGLAINLPHARPRHPARAHALAGPFKRLLVQRRGTGTQIRIFFTPDQAAEVLTEPGALRVNVRPKGTRS